jgi:predicted RNase H-like HicB family nuclease
MNYKFTAVITKEEDIFVAFCPELDIASQGYTIEEAKKNLKEAVSLFFEHASLEEIRERLKEDIYITPIEVAVA